MSELLELAKEMQALIKDLEFGSCNEDPCCPECYERQHGGFYDGYIAHEKNCRLRRLMFVELRDGA